MGYQIIEKDRAVKFYENFLKTGSFDSDYLDSNHQEIRSFFLKEYNARKNDFPADKYRLDLELALRFYEFIHTQKDFDNIYASDFDFWRTIAIFDIPDIIADRFKRDALDHYYKKGSRIYPYVLYWYTHLSWQGNKEETYDVLKDNDEDVMLQLVERTTKLGTDLKFYRTFMRYYSKQDYDAIKREIKSKAAKEKKTRSLFRIAMVKNTEKLLVTRPEIYKGGIENYVRMLLDVKEELV